MYGSRRHVGKRHVGSTGTRDRLGARPVMPHAKRRAEGHQSEYDPSTFGPLAETMTGPNAIDLDPGSSADGTNDREQNPGEQANDEAAPPRNAPVIEAPPPELCHQLRDAQPDERPKDHAKDPPLPPSTP